jgi:hypothetical protein
VVGAHQAAQAQHRLADHVQVLAAHPRVRHSAEAACSVEDRSLSESTL